MLLIYGSHVFELPVETKFEVCYPRSYRNATSVLQRRRPGKIKQKNSNNKTKHSNDMETHRYCLLKSSLSRKCSLSFKKEQNKTKKQQIKQDKTKDKIKK